MKGYEATKSIDNKGGLLKIWVIPFGVLKRDGTTVNFTC
jgi:hypothetical protein